MSKSFEKPRHASTTSGCSATRSVRVCTSTQLLRMARAASAERLGELDAGAERVEEQIVGDKDVVADLREVAADRVDRAATIRAVDVPPHRTEAAAIGAPARGLDQPHRLLVDDQVVALE